MSQNASDLPLPGATESGVIDLDTEFLGSFGMRSPDTSEPPLGTDGLAGDKGAGAEKPGVKEKGVTEPSKKAAGEEIEDNSEKAAGDGDEGGEKEDLEAIGDDEEEAAIKAAPKEHQATLRKISKAAKFEDHVRDGAKAPKEIVAYIKGLSAARYDDISAEVVKDRLGNVVKFIEKDLDDESYTKLATELIKRDPAWVIGKITGRDGLKLSDLAEALEAKDSGNKDSVVDLPELDDAVMAELAQDYEEVADFIKAIKQARTGTLPKAFTSKLSAAEARAVKAEEELATLKGGGKSKTGDRTTKVAEGEDEAGDTTKATAHEKTPTIRKAVEADLDDYVTNQAKHKDGMDLAVTDEEREAAPEVAELKDTKLEEWIFGSTSKKIPSFINGLMTHFKTNEKFMRDAKQVAFYANKGEQENALLEAKKIRKYVDAYRKVRADLPSFKRLDALIERAAKEAGRPAARVEKHIPGGGSQTASPGSKQVETDDDLVNSFGLG